MSPPVSEYVEQLVFGRLLPKEEEPEALRRLAAEWRELASSCGELRLSIQRESRGLEEALGRDSHAGRSMVESAARLIEHSEQLSRYGAALADWLDAVANDVELALAEMSFLLVTVLCAGTTVAAVVRARARFLVLLEGLISRLGMKSAAVVSARAGLCVADGLMFGVAQAGLNIGIQSAQHTRDEVDWATVFAAGLAGAGSAMGGKLGAGLSARVVGTRAVTGWGRAVVAVGAGVSGVVGAAAATGRVDLSLPQLVSGGVLGFAAHAVAMTRKVGPVIDGALSGGDARPSGMDSPQRSGSSPDASILTRLARMSEHGALDQLVDLSARGGSSVTLVGPASRGQVLGSDGAVLARLEDVAGPRDVGGTDRGGPSGRGGVAGVLPFLPQGEGGVWLRPTGRQFGGWELPTGPTGYTTSDRAGTHRVGVFGSVVRGGDGSGGVASASMNTGFGLSSVWRNTADVGSDGSVGKPAVSAGRVGLLEPQPMREVAIRPAGAIETRPESSAGVAEPGRLDHSGTTSNSGPSVGHGLVERRSDTAEAATWPAPPVQGEPAKAEAMDTDTRADGNSARRGAFADDPYGAVIRVPSLLPGVTTSPDPSAAAPGVPDLSGQEPGRSQGPVTADDTSGVLRRTEATEQGLGETARPSWTPFTQPWRPVHPDATSPGTPDDPTLRPPVLDRTARHPHVITPPAAIPDPSEPQDRPVVPAPVSDVPATVPDPGLPELPRAVDADDSTGPSDESAEPITRLRDLLSSDTGADTPEQIDALKHWTDVLEQALREAALLRDHVENKMIVRGAVTPVPGFWNDELDFAELERERRNGRARLLELLPAGVVAEHLGALHQHPERYTPEVNELFRKYVDADTTLYLAETLRGCRKRFDQLAMSTREIGVVADDLQKYVALCTRVEQEIVELRRDDRERAVLLEKLDQARDKRRSAFEHLYQRLQDQAEVIGEYGVLTNAVARLRAETRAEFRSLRADFEAILLVGNYDSDVDEALREGSRVRRELAAELDLARSRLITELARASTIHLLPHELEDPRRVADISDMVEHLTTDGRNHALDLAMLSFIQTFDEIQTVEGCHRADSLVQVINELERAAVIARLAFTQALYQEQASMYELADEYLHRIALIHRIDHHASAVRDATEQPAHPAVDQRWVERMSAKYELPHQELGLGRAAEQRLAGKLLRTRARLNSLIGVDPTDLPDEEIRLAQLQAKQTGAPTDGPSLLQSPTGLEWDGIADRDPDWRLFKAALIQEFIELRRYAEWGHAAKLRNIEIAELDVALDEAISEVALNLRGTSESATVHPEDQARKGRLGFHLFKLRSDLAYVADDAAQAFSKTSRRIGRESITQLWPGSDAVQRLEERHANLLSEIAAYLSVDAEQATPYEVDELLSGMPSAIRKHLTEVIQTFRVLDRMLDLAEEFHRAEVWVRAIDALDNGIATAKSWREDPGMRDSQTGWSSRYDELTALARRLDALALEREILAQPIRDAKEMNASAQLAKASGLSLSALLEEPEIFFDMLNGARLNVCNQLIVEVARIEPSRADIDPTRMTPSQVRDESIRLELLLETQPSSTVTSALQYAREIMRIDNLLDLISDWRHRQQQRDELNDTLDAAFNKVAVWGMDSHRQHIAADAPLTCLIAMFEVAMQGNGPRPKFRIPDGRMDAIALEGVDGHDAARWSGANWRRFRDVTAAFEWVCASPQGAHAVRCRRTVVLALDYQPIDHTVGANALVIKIDDDGRIVAAEPQQQLDDGGNLVLSARFVEGAEDVRAWASMLSTDAAAATVHALAFQGETPIDPLVGGDPDNILSRQIPRGRIHGPPRFASDGPGHRDDHDEPAGAMGQSVSQRLSSPSLEVGRLRHELWKALIRHGGALPFGSVSRALAWANDAEFARGTAGLRGVNADVLRSLRFEGSIPAVARAMSSDEVSVEKWLGAAAREVAVSIRANRGGQGLMAAAWQTVEEANRQELAETIPRLPRRVRAVADLLLVRGVSVSEAAAALGWSANQVMGSISRAVYRINAILGHARRVEGVIEIGKMRWEPPGRVFFDGESIELRPRSAELLRLLMKHPGEIVSPIQIKKLFEEVGYRTEPSVAVKALCVELGRWAAGCIITVRGKGYYFDAGIAAARYREPIEIGNIRWESPGRVIVNGEDVGLPRRSAELLGLLMSYPDEAVSPARITAALRPMGYNSEPVRMIARLRSQLDEKTAKFIVSVRPGSYRFDTEAALRASGKGRTSQLSRESETKATAAGEAGVLEIGNVRWEPRGRVVFYGKSIALGPRSSALLRLLMKNPGKIISATEITALLEQQGYKVFPYRDVKRLRVELGERAATCIVSVRHKGYYFDVEIATTGYREPIEIGNIRWEPPGRVVFDGEKVRLQLRSAELLRLLMSHPDQDISIDQIATALTRKGYSSEPKVMIEHLRAELGHRAAECIKTVFPSGYRFDSQAAERPRSAIEIDNIRWEPQGRVLIDGVDARLRPRSAELMYLLMTNPDTIVSLEKIAAELTRAGYRKPPGDAMGALRRELGNRLSARIINVFGKGYILVTKYSFE